MSKKVRDRGADERTRGQEEDQGDGSSAGLDDKPANFGGQGVSQNDASRHHDSGDGQMDTLDESDAGLAKSEQLLPADKLPPKAPGDVDSQQETAEVEETSAAKQGDGNKGQINESEDSVKAQLGAAGDGGESGATSKTEKKKHHDEKHHEKHHHEKHHDEKHHHKDKHHEKKHHEEKDEGESTNADATAAQKTKPSEAKTTSISNGVYCRR